MQSLRIKTPCAQTQAMKVRVPIWKSRSAAKLGRLVLVRKGRLVLMRKGSLALNQIRKHSLSAKPKLVHRRTLGRSRKAQPAKPTLTNVLRLPEPHLPLLRPQMRKVEQKRLRRDRGVPTLPPAARGAAQRRTRGRRLVRPSTASLKRWSRIRNNYIVTNCAVAAAVLRSATGSHDSVDH